MMPDSGPRAHVADELERTGLCVVTAFMPDAEVAALAAECRALYGHSLLQPAALGRGATRRHDPSLRGDRTLWFDRCAPTPAQSHYWSRMQALQRALNRRLLLGLGELEAHYALYPPGARYTRHRDRFRDDDARVLSSVLYLNSGWIDADGGALRIYLDATNANPAHLDVMPHAGSLVLFLSAEFEHEVLPASRERLSIAGWFRQSIPM